MSTPSDQPQPFRDSAEPVVCYRHRDRETGLRCTRCGRPACPECLREASVGYQCLECVREGRRTTRQPTNSVGAPSRQGSRPVVTLTLVAVNVVIFVITVVQAQNVRPNGNSALFDEWVLWPLAAAGGEWWRFVTSGFLHYGLIHIAMNMIALWIIGRDLEMVLGRLRFGVVYGLSLLGGSASVFLFTDPTSGVAGASGAVFGLMGGVVIACYRLKISPGPALGIIGINLVLSFTIPGISWLGHLGGLVVGALATLAMLYAPRAYRRQVQWGAVAVLLIALIAVFALRDASFGVVQCFDFGTVTRCGRLSSG